ncbi:MAG: tRNA (adenosine(37)-N6)-threonylcarbamoyltransferase complex ATPase subunit type 1 TsaE [Deltaproteobacteria bacterium]|nr:tRNA (adenosine(37)-N6)-threonylcarbamoyltransferase complex ATPase subunit type 1 TsaE [Deltaproteobacteria bacterium]
MNHAKIITLDQLPLFAVAVSKKLKQGDVVSLVGDIGSGKTSFMFYLMRALGLKDMGLFASPTFTIINTYPLRSLTIYHVDLYRLNRFEEIEALDILSCFGEKNTMTFVEWGDKFTEMEGLYTKKIFLEHVPDHPDQRMAKCEGFLD